MDIKEIAIQTWAEVSKSTSVGESIAVAFAEALLAKLARQEVKPVGWFKYDKVSQCWHPQYEQYAATHAVPQRWQKLYTEVQYFAGQLRTAEACARMAAYSVSRETLIEAIRNGEWRNYYDTSRASL